jgi:hypothetical protein
MLSSVPPPEAFRPVEISWMIFPVGTPSSSTRLGRLPGCSFPARRGRCPPRPPSVCDQAGDGALRCGGGGRRGKEGLGSAVRDHCCQLRRRKEEQYGRHRRRNNAFLRCTHARSSQPCMSTKRRLHVLAAASSSMDPTRGRAARCSHRTTSIHPNRTCRRAFSQNLKETTPGCL